MWSEGPQTERSQLTTGALDPMVDRAVQTVGRGKRAVIRLQGNRKETTAAGMGDAAAELAGPTEAHGDAAQGFESSHQSS
jgi:hypothetical protein